MSKQKTLSLIVPCFNEAENIDNFYTTALSILQSKLSEYDYEIVFINDGSRDNTANLIRALQKKDPQITFINFVRNFGKEIAVTAGIDNCRGDAAIIVDADLQYPLELLPQFVEAWKQGHQHVIGLRDTKKTSNLVEIIGSRLFHKLMSLLIEQGKHNASALDYRLIDREVIDDFKLFTENDRIVRGLLDWLGFEPYYIPYTEKPRAAGVSHFNFWKRFNLAVNSFVSHSLLPLKLIGLLGLVITLISGLVGFASFLSILFNFDWIYFSGPFLLGTLNTFLIGIVLMCIGLVAFYIGSIKKEVLNRPLYIVKKN